MFARALILGALAACLLSVACTSAQEHAPVAGGQKGTAKSAGEAPREEAKSSEHGAGVKEKGHAEEHDPYDLSHANASYDLTDPSTFKADAAIATFIIFLLLLGILIKFAWGPISRGLEARERGIEEKIEQARLAAEQATEQLRQYEARLAAASEEAQQIVAKARQDADTAGQRIIAEAGAAAQKERERAVADIAAARDQALREIAERSVDAAVSLARNIIRREVRPADHEQLIQDALKQFPTTSAN